MLYNLEVDSVMRLKAQKFFHIQIAAREGRSATICHLLDAA
jgi:hypothetical protein